jgi:hypothetical protein
MSVLANRSVASKNDDEHHLLMRCSLGALITTLMNSRPRASGCAAKITRRTGLRSSNGRISRTRSFGIVLGRKKVASLHNRLVCPGRHPAGRGASSELYPAGRRARHGWGSGG